MSFMKLQVEELSGHTIQALEDKGFKGIDISLETSLFEYGYAWIHEAQPNEYRIFYGVEMEGEEYTHFDWASFSDELDLKKEFDWIKSEDWKAFLDSMGVDWEEWSTWYLPSKICDLARYFGNENIFGTSYYRFEIYKDKFRWRLSAPGYLDCTDWNFSSSLEECIVDALGMHGDEFDITDWVAIGDMLEGFKSFLNGYLLGLAFTSRDEENEGDIAFPCSGCDISDHISPEEVFELLSNEDRIQVYSDCVNFYLEARELLNFRELSTKEASRAGSDFHLTRNGHGAGFWDGDWKEGEKLTKLCKPYSGAELYRFINDEGNEEWVIQ